jgi:hypothetical protein
MLRVLLLLLPAEQLFQEIWNFRCLHRPLLIAVGVKRRVACAGQHLA